MIPDPEPDHSAAPASGATPSTETGAEASAPWSLRAVAQPGMAGVEMLRTASLLILALLGTMGAMYLLRRVLVPFVLAMFLSVLVSPIIDGMVHRLRWPRTVAVLVTFVLVALAMVVAIATLVPAAVGLINRGNQYASEVRRVMDEGIGFVARILPAEELEAEAGAPTGDSSPVEELSPPHDEGLDRAREVDARADLETQLREAFEEQVYPGVGVFFLSFAGNLLGLASDGVLVGIFLLFLLLGRGDARVSPESLRGQIERGVQGYMITTIAVSALTGLLVGITLELLGVPLGWGFGVAAFVLNFIPNIGSIIATLLPLPIVIFYPEMNPAAKVLAFVIPSIIQFSIGNLLMPLLLGDRLDISPVVILLGLIFFGTIWGLAGMVLAAPMLAVVKIAFEQVPTLRPVAGVLAGRWSHPRAKSG